MTTAVAEPRDRGTPCTATACHAFHEAIRDAGLEPPEEVIADGGIHRFASDGRRGDDSGWYVLYDDGIPAGSFGCWRTDVKQNWSATPERAMNAAEEAEYKAKMAAARKAREEDKARRQSEAATEAAMIWEAAKPATDEHPYLARKGVKALGLRQDADGRLVVPVRIRTALRSLQYIDRKGRKLFLTNGEVTGGCCSIGTTSDAKALCVVEGFATGASVHAGKTVLRSRRGPTGGKSRFE